MSYTIKPEYLSQWGEQTDEHTIITEEELADLAKEWGKSEEELKQQLIPVD